LSSLEVLKALVVKIDELVLVDHLSFLERFEEFFLFWGAVEADQVVNGLGLGGG